MIKKSFNRLLYMEDEKTNFARLSRLILIEKDNSDESFA